MYRMKSLAASFLFLLLLASSSFAVLSPEAGPYSVGSDSSTVAKNTFTLAEIPFIYVSFDNSQVNTSEPLFVQWIWRNPSSQIVGQANASISAFSGDSTQAWNSLANWNAVKKTGEWTVQTHWINALKPTNGTGGNGIARASFTVTPEPASCALFLLGASPIAYRLFKKRKKSL